MVLIKRRKISNHFEYKQIFLIIFFKIFCFRTGNVVILHKISSCMNIDPQKLHGRDLFIYYTQDCPDENLMSIVRMLPIALPNDEDVFAVLERVANGEMIDVCYPSEGNVPTGVEKIGEIPDGFLYFTKNW